jgi:outer membrane protein assembly factor BamB
VQWRFACESGLDRRARQAQATANAAATPDAPVAAALLFNELIAQNSVLGMLASDGRRIYCIDQCPESDAADSSDFVSQSNRLLALALDAVDQEPGSLLWTTGGDGRFFLGPPLPTDDGLFAIVERDSLVSLIALDARTGQLRWEQPISLVALTNEPNKPAIPICFGQGLLH